MFHVSCVLLGHSHESRSSVGELEDTFNCVPRSLVLGHVPGNKNSIIQ